MAEGRAASLSLEAMEPKMHAKLSYPGLFLRVVGFNQFKSVNTGLAAAHSAVSSNIRCPCGQLVAPGSWITMLYAHIVLLVQHTTD